MDEQAASAPAKKGGIGCGAMIAILLIALIFLIIGGNAAFGYYLDNCGDVEPFSCFLNQTEDPEPEGAVVATGTYSVDEHSVQVTANIPLGGGAVTGSISGTCNGKLKGTFDGKNNGAISGTIVGGCNPFIINIPASATYGGIVNKDSKTVPISFTGKAPGMTHEGSMSLSY